MYANHNTGKKFVTSWKKWITGNSTTTSVSYHLDENSCQQCDISHDNDLSRADSTTSTSDVDDASSTIATYTSYPPMVMIDDDIDSDFDPDDLDPMNTTPTRVFS